MNSIQTVFTDFQYMPSTEMGAVRETMKDFMNEMALGSVTEHKIVIYDKYVKCSWSPSK